MAVITTDPTRVSTKPTARRFSVFGDVVQSEWTKLRSLRSTYWTLLAAFVGIVGISALIASVYVNQYPGMSVADRAHFDPTSFSLSGVVLAQFAIGVLGVLMITGEYGTGAIRSTFAAVPQRRIVLAAKATVLAGTSLVVGLVSCFAAFFIGQAILSTQNIGASLGDPGVLRAVAGSGIYLVVLGLLALGIGTLLRRSAGAITALFGVLLALPLVLQLLPGSWTDTVGKFLPSNAGGAISRTVSAGPHPRGGSSLSPWVGLAVFCAYAVVALVLGGIALRRRDA